VKGRPRENQGSARWDRVRKLTSTNVAGVLVAVMAAAIVVAAAAWAGSQHAAGDEGGSGWSGRRGARAAGDRGLRGLAALTGRGRLAAELSLTADQRSKVRAIVKSAFPDVQPLIEKRWETRAALRDAVHADAISEERIRAAAGAVTASEADLAVARARVLERVRGVLTPDQLGALKDARARLERRGEIRRRIYHERAGDILDTL
jgi:Spy/CpxP family protein refolding chaperone